MSNTQNGFLENSKSKSQEKIIQELIDQDLDLDKLCARLSTIFSNQSNALIAIEIIRQVLNAKRRKG